MKRQGVDTAIRSPNRKAKREGKMKTNRLIMTMIVAAGLMLAGGARAGSLVPTDLPGPTMRSLLDMWDRLVLLDGRSDDQTTALQVCNTNMMLLITMLAEERVAVSNVTLLVTEVAERATAISNQVQSVANVNQQNIQDLQQQLLHLSSRLGDVQQQLGTAGTPVPPADMVTIPAGSFLMGACTNVGHESCVGETPQHTVYVSAFYMDKTEVTKGKWDEVYAWATSNGYAFENAGSGAGPYHPVHTVNWYHCVKWCNARSEMIGLRAAYTISGEVYRVGSALPDCDLRATGYRLPTEAEWEKVARGGASNLSRPAVD